MKTIHFDISQPSIWYEILKWALKTTHLSQKWAPMIFSISHLILLIVHENDQFWYITTYLEYEILKWLQNDSIEL